MLFKSRARNTIRSARAIVGIDSSRANVIEIVVGRVASRATQLLKAIRESQKRNKWPDALITLIYPRKFNTIDTINAVK